MTKAQEKLLDYIRKHNQLPSLDEATDMYVSSSLRSDGRCLRTSSKVHVLEHKYTVLKSSAEAWLKSSIGSLVLQKELNIEFDL